jgi:hypothetical protein
MAGLKEVFDPIFAKVKFNRSLSHQQYLFHTSFMNKNEEHLLFLSGKLTGVHFIRFTPKEFDIFYNDMLDIDVGVIKAAVSTVEAIDPRWVVASDSFNLVCMYMVHRWLTTPALDNKAREQAAISAALIFFYRSAAAMLNEWFRYPVDVALAEATYANLSNRYLIRKLESWQEVLMYRAVELVKGDSVHRRTFETFNDDYAVVQLVNDARGRMADIIKNIYAEMMRTHQRGERLQTSKDTTLNMDGAEILKDKVHGLTDYTQYVLGIMHDEASFIKSELIDIVSKIMSTMQVRGFKTSLEWMSEYCGHQQYGVIEEFIKLVLIHSYHYFLTHDSAVMNSRDISGLLGRLKNIYVSSRSSDADLMKLRELGSEIVGHATGKTNEQTMAAIRTGLMLYIVVRAYTKHHYSG